MQHPSAPEVPALLVDEGSLPLTLSRAAWSATENISLPYSFDQSSNRRLVIICFPERKNKFYRADE